MKLKAAPKYGRRPLKSANDSGSESLVKMAKPGSGVIAMFDPFH